jgi:hypothetical protein
VCDVALAKVWVENTHGNRHPNMTSPAGSNELSSDFLSGDSR